MVVQSNLAELCGNFDENRMNVEIFWSTSLIVNIRRMAE